MDLVMCVLLLIIEILLLDGNIDSSDNENYLYCNFLVNH